MRTRFSRLLLGRESSLFEVSFNEINKLIFKLWGKVVEKLHVDKLVALKSLTLNLSNTSPEFFIDQHRFLSDLS